MSVRRPSGDNLRQFVERVEDGRKQVPKGRHWFVVVASDISLLVPLERPIYLQALQRCVDSFWSASKGKRLIGAALLAGPHVHDNSQPQGGRSVRLELVESLNPVSSWPLWLGCTVSASSSYVLFVA